MTREFLIKQPFTFLFCFHFIATLDVDLIRDWENGIIWAFRYTFFGGRWRRQRENGLKTEAIKRNLSILRFSQNINYSRLIGSARRCRPNNGSFSFCMKFRILRAFDWSRRARMRKSRIESYDRCTSRHAECAFHSFFSPVFCRQRLSTFACRADATDELLASYALWIIQIVFKFLSYSSLCRTIEIALSSRERQPVSVSAFRLFVSPLLFNFIWLL